MRVSARSTLPSVEAIVLDVALSRRRDASMRATRSDRGGPGFLTDLGTWPSLGRKTRATSPESSSIFDGTDERNGPIQGRVSLTAERPGLLDQRAGTDPHRQCAAPHRGGPEQASQAV